MLSQKLAKARHALVLVIGSLCVRLIHVEYVMRAMRDIHIFVRIDYSRSVGSEKQRDLTRYDDDMRAFRLPGALEIYRNQIIGSGGTSRSYDDDDNFALRWSSHPAWTL